MRYLNCSLFLLLCFLLLACRSQQQTHEVISQQVTASEWHHGESPTLWLDSLSKQLSAEFDSLEFWIEPVSVVEERAPSQSRVKPALRIRGKAKSASLKSQSDQVAVHAESAATIDSALHKENATSNVVIKEEKVAVAKPPDRAWLVLLLIVIFIFLYMKVK